MPWVWSDDACIHLLGARGEGRRTQLNKWINVRPIGKMILSGLDTRWWQWVGEMGRRGWLALEADC